MKRKRVSFGGQLSPELFDKRLPPDSPLRKGAAPRRSLSLYKPIKQSLLRRASVIGLLKECESPKAKSPAKMRTPSPKKSPKGASPKTPTSAKKSPKTQSPSQRTPSPKSKSSSPGKKAATPKKTSPKSPKATTPKSKSPSPEKKAATPKKTSPKSPKATTPKSKSPSPGKKAATPKKTSPKSPKATTPKSKSPSPGKKAATPKKASPKAQSPKMVDGTPTRKSTGCMVTPVKSPDLTPNVQGRFSVSRINTPSPVAEVMEQVPAATPKIPLRRKSMKSSSKQTPLKSATKVMRRKSSIMRSTKKVMSSWADIVRFGKAKVQVGAPTRAQVIKKSVKKKAGPKSQTPKRRFLDHVGTGHAASPATIVVGRAHRLRVAHSVAAPPKIVTNTAVLRKNMKMDEDLTGLTEMFKTPKNEKRRSAKTASKTPQTDLSKSLLEPSVLNTPEETGEMVVSPMSVASTVKGQRYNSEAVQRLLDGEESFASEIPAVDMQSETSVRGTAEIKLGTPKTPKQKPPMPEGVTRPKKIMTPKQKAEPIEDAKTPKQKSDQQECLSAIKCIMKTNEKEKATPIEDPRRKLLKTPEQKIQQQEECLTEVKQIMKTPKEKAVPVEDLWGKLLKTPKQHIEQQECLSAVKTLMKTPDQKVEQPESLTGVTRSMRTPKQQTVQQPCLTGVNRLMKTPKEKYEPTDDIRGKPLLTPKQKIDQQECLTGVKRLKTPKVKVPPVEKNFGIKRLMRSPRLRGNAQVEDFEGLEELMKEPAEEQTSVFTEETINNEQPETNPEVVDDLSEVEKVMATEEILVLPESTSITLAEETKIMASVVESVQEESAPEAKPVRGRRAKTTEPTAENKQDHSEVTEAPVRARRGRKVQTSDPGQTAKTPEEPLPEESAPEPTVKPRRGRIAKKPKKLIKEDQVIVTESTAEPQTESEQILPTAVHEVEPSTAPEVPVVKTRRGRKNKADEPCDVTIAQAAEETKEAEIVEDSIVRHKKPAQSIRAKATESEVPAAAENKNDSEDAVAPVRSRRGKKTEAPAASAVRQRRGRAGKVQEKDTEETQQMPENISEHSNDQTCAPGSTEEMVEENPSEPTKEMAHEKPKRGRKIKAQGEPVQPEIIAVEREPLVVEAKHVEDVQPEQSVPRKKVQRGRKAKIQVEPPQVEMGSTAEEGSSSVCETVEDVQLEQHKPAQKARRGGRTKPADEPSVQPDMKTEKSEPVEETQPEQAAPAEKPKRGRRARTTEDSHTTEVSQPPVRGKRSRTAKFEQEEKSDLEQHAAGELKSPEPAKKMRRTKKDDLCVEIQTKVADETPDIVEPLKANELVGAAPKSRRGAHKMREAVTEEVSASSSTDKPKRGRKGKQTNEEIKVVEVEVEQAPEDDFAKVKPTGRRGKTAVQHGTSDTVPAKRARRGTAVATEESTEQDTQVIAEPVPVEPIKRGRRAAKIPARTEEAETKDQDNSTKESSHGTEDTQTSKRSVKWKADFEVFEVTPLKSLRGRKTKSAGQKEAESSNESQKATDRKGKDLTEKAQPAKKSRRGAKAADVAEKSTAVLENKEAETQPKTRRGRTAKK
uniref:PP1-binding domain-containing protein n=1 Tax=Neogobius melanostomus TaxID=47308 RepID=A0A8C6WF01_9GOBI